MMKRISFFFFTVFLLAASDSKLLIAIEAYIAELVEWTVISDAELLAFEASLQKGQLVNPIDCETKLCSAVESLHHDNFEELIKGDLQKEELEVWLREFLSKRRHDHTKREETTESTRPLWKKIPQCIAVGADYACAVNADHKTVCWTWKGELLSPPSALPVSQVSIGLYQTCVVEENGTLQCMGTLGAEHAIPSDLGPVFQVSVGASFTSVLEENGSVRSWGQNGANQCTIPSALGSLVEISAGSTHSCALDDRGRVHCWGSNADGESTVPSTLEAVEQVVAASTHTCVLKKGGSIQCWGSNRYGQKEIPSDLAPLVKIAASYRYTCALEVHGNVRCWGGIPGDLNSKLLELGPLMQIATYFDHLCVVTEKGKVHCFRLSPNYYNTYILQDGFPPPEDLKVNRDESRSVRTALKQKP